MTLLDRYILKEWLKVFGMALGAMVGLILIGEIFNSMPDFIQWKTPAGRVALYYLYQIPEQMPIVLPVATLVSMLFILGHLHKNQEITAMRAAGLSVRRITRSLWVAGAACTAALLLVNTVIAAASTEAARTIYENSEFDFRRKAEKSAAKADHFSSVFFDNGRDSRRWRIARLGAYTGQASGVQVYELDGTGAPLRQVFAESARFDFTRGFWVFENGREVEYAKDEPAFTAQRAFATKELPYYREKPMHMRLMTMKPSNLSLAEIDSLLAISSDMESAKTSALAVRYHSLLASPFACLVCVGLAIPFAVAGVRTNPMIGVSNAIGVFILYYLFDRIGYALGSQQILPPMLAAWLPLLLVLAYAAHLARKMN